MTPDLIKCHVDQLPYMTLDKAWILYDLISEFHLNNCLELGFYHGVSTLYLAGALNQFASSNLTTIDLTSAKLLSPNATQLMQRVTLRTSVEIFYEEKSYTWRLMKFLEEGSVRKFNFCFIDGGHTWDTTGYAFFLVDKLLCSDGWIVFDDIDGICKEITTQHDKISKEELALKPIEKVFNLLVKTSGNYHNFKILGNMAFAQKR